MAASSVEYAQTHGEILENLTKQVVNHFRTSHRSSHARANREVPLSSPELTATIVTKIRERQRCRCQQPRGCHQLPTETHNPSEAIHPQSRTLATASIQSSKPCRRPLGSSRDSKALRHLGVVSRSLGRGVPTFCSGSPSTNPPRPPPFL